MSLDHWDTEIRPRLNQIWYYAKRLWQTVEELGRRPNFETLAEEQLDVTIKTLEESLNLLKKVKEAYLKKETTE